MQGLRWAALLLAAASAAAGGGERHRLALFGALSVPRVVLDANVSVAVNATVLAASGAGVQVTWSVAPDGIAPSSTDFIALFVPADADVSTTAPVKFKNVTASDGARSGSLTFSLVNMRQPGAFWYFRGGLGSPIAVATSPAVAFARPNEPTGVHIALTEKPGQLSVSWTSASDAGVTVKWGLSGGPLSNIARPAAGSSLSYNRSQLCGAGGGLGDTSFTSPAAGVGYMDPGFIHRVLLSARGLPDGAAIDYQVGSSVTADWSQIFTARMPPTLGGPTRFLAVADLGQAEADGSSLVAGNPLGREFEPGSYFDMLPSLNNTARMSDDISSGAGQQLVLHNGDLSYAMGYVSMWDVFGQEIQSSATRVPWMTCLGNHEVNWPGNPYSGLFNSSDRSQAITDSGGECGVPATLRFPMPLPHGRSPSTPWYSFDFGAVHFTTISTEHPLLPGTPQYEWVAADLANASAAREAAVSGAPGYASAPRWLVFNGHRPFYIHSPYNEGKQPDTPIAQGMAAAFEPLWAQHGVDLTLTGHHHSYQRSKPVAYAAVQPGCPDGEARGTVHVVMGHGGAGFSGISADDPESSFFEVACNDAHGYLRIQADATSLQLQSINGATGEQLDSFSLTKPAGPRTCFAAAPLPPPTVPSPPPDHKKDVIGDDVLLTLIICGIALVAGGFGLRALRKRGLRRAAARDAALLDSYAELGVGADEEEGGFLTHAAVAAPSPQYLKRTAVAAATAAAAHVAAPAQVHEVAASPHAAAPASPVFPKPLIVHTSADHLMDAHVAAPAAAAAPEAKPVEALVEVAPAAVEEEVKAEPEAEEVEAVAPAVVEEAAAAEAEPAEAAAAETAAAEEKEEETEAAPAAAQAVPAEPKAGGGGGGGGGKKRGGKGGKGGR